MTTISITISTWFTLSYDQGSNSLLKPLGENLVFLHLPIRHSLFALVHSPSFIFKARCYSSDTTISDSLLHKHILIFFSLWICGSQRIEIMSFSPVLYPQSYDSISAPRATPLSVPLEAWAFVHLLLLFIKFHPLHPPHSSEQARIF